MFNTEHLQEKWQPVLEHPDLPEIKDPYRRAVTTVILENQERAMGEDREFLGEVAPNNANGSKCCELGSDPYFAGSSCDAFTNCL